MRRRVLAALMILVAIAATAFYFLPSPRKFDPGDAADYLRAVGTEWWAPFAFAVFYVVFTLILVPPLLMSAAAALMWGWFAGGLIELFVATIAAIPPFSLARWTGAGWVRHRLSRPGARNVYERIHRDGFVALLLLRLVPVIPYVLLNYAAGLAPITSARYAIATFAGMIPSIFVFTYFVDAVADGATDFRDAYPRVLLAGAMVAALVIVTRAASRRFR